MLPYKSKWKKRGEVKAEKEMCIRTSEEGIQAKHAAPRFRMHVHTHAHTLSSILWRPMDPTVACWEITRVHTEPVTHKNDKALKVHMHTGHSPFWQLLPAKPHSSLWRRKHSINATGKTAPKFQESEMGLAKMAFNTGIEHRNPGFCNQRHVIFHDH